jgi:hypothetical protein
MQVASKNVEKYNNLILVYFLISNGVNGAIIIVDNEKIPITQPIKLSVIPFCVAIEGNNGDIIENPKPQSKLIKNKIFAIFILI